MDVSQWFMAGVSTTTTTTTTSTTSGPHQQHTRRMKGPSQQQQQQQEQHDRLFGNTSSAGRRRTTTSARRQLQKENNNNKQMEDAKEEDDAFQGVVVDEPNPEEEKAPAEEEADATEEATEEPVQDEDNQQQQPVNEEPDEEEEQDTGLETRIDLVKLVPFDVKLTKKVVAADTAAADILNTFALTDIVTDWMDESLAAQVARMELGLSHSAFDSVILEERTVTTEQDGARRQLQEGTTTIASYEGVTLWKHVTPSELQVMTPSLMEDIQRQALLQDDRLLELLQASPAEGLGSSVTDVRAYINPNPTGFAATNGQPTTKSDTSNADNLELIIVAAIVVACMALSFLLFSLFWAYRLQARQNDLDAQALPDGANAHNKPNKTLRSPDGTAGGTDSDYGEDSSKMTTPANMNVVVNSRHRPIAGGADDDDTSALEAPSAGVYPESVISDDISTSLTAYYRSGMGSRPIYNNNNNRALGPNTFDDQASMSSMESYGYSLDGYAPSLGGQVATTAPKTPNDNDDAGEEEEGANP